MDRASDAATINWFTTAASSPDAILAASQAIHAAALEQSTHLRSGNFTRIGSSDLEFLFQQYDERFFQGRVRPLVESRPAGHLTFRLSKRMTKVGGTTALHRLRTKTAKGPRDRHHFEIAISTTLLFQSFRDPARTVRVNGLACRDRLEALQRIFEHELIHLIELAAWDVSSCAAPRFRELARRYFGHLTFTHDLVTQREVAQASYKIDLGCRVAFLLDGVRHRGVVNRITRRATVLVEAPDGAPYSDGRRYHKFYIPLAMLERD